MRGKSRRTGPSRDRRSAPRLEPLETRDLPTVIISHHVLGAAAVQADASTRSAAIAQPLGIAAHLGQAGAIVTPPPDATGGLPTPHEIRRQRYVGRFKGDYVIGPGRYTDQAAALSSLGYGGSNQAFHLWTNMRITVPSDPNATTTGQIYMIPWSIATTGTALILDLQGDPKSIGPNGFPTHYTWTVNGNSGGLYQLSQGQGTFDIKFFRPGPGPQKGMLHGQLQYAINGSINVVGIFNDTGVLGNLPNGRRGGG